ncbi:MAG TPA: hypothetical protein VFR51_19385, partial [Pyrinomonadaceae bacterium]|nr:hypothetical protein [Pyrinomonadaceae bacterium]
FTGLRAHQCMLAEVIFANDPNPADNLVQANMDFESVAPASGGGGGGGAGGAGGANEFAWRAGNAAFSNFNPAVGRNMFFEVDTKNMNRQDGWDFQLDGVQPLNAPNLFVARIAGKDSLQARLRLKAPAADVIGKTIKENLVVPPKAGGFQVNAKIPSGEPPVYVKVNGGTTLLIANYAFSAQDPQHVDLDGSRKLLPPNGPSGLPDSVLQAAVRSVGEKFKLLLVPTAPLGALVGSWDNFQTGFVIGDGVQVDVPPNAKFLALGINDAAGFYPDNTGTGFRVKIVERRGGSAQAPAIETSTDTPTFVKASLNSPRAAQAAKAIPIRDVIPTLCINGYEDIGQKRMIDGKAHELFRYLGNVCWGIINVVPPNRSEKPDQGDVFDGPQAPRPKGCGAGRDNKFALASFISVLGILMIRRRSRKAKRK